MRRAELIVLKFGGSVLLDEQRLRIAVHEIYRWRREGWRVVAVVSALAGRTDALLGACDRLSDDASAHARSAVVANGEFESAALLGLHLDRAGIPATVLGPGSVHLRARGPALDAEPIGLDGSLIEAALARDGVVVVPGYVAHDAQGRTVTLGRGGSDLTALFLAQSLGADNCRLIKDVDGLYERDPARPGPPPRRFRAATYRDALGTDGSIIQHKAVRFAQLHGLRFELGRFNGTEPTLIGARESVLERGADAPARLTVGLLGLGTVGGGVLELLGQLPDLFEVRGVCVRDSRRRREGVPCGVEVTDDPIALAASGVDIVVEAMGGLEPAAGAVRAAIARGASVATANKALLAAHGRELRRLACARGVRLLGSASVGGSMPAIEAASRLRPRVERIRAVLNGTSNFVLNRVAEGRTPIEAIAEAQRRGLAEADPSRDLDGRDSIDKLRVLAATLGLAPARARLVRADRIDEQSLRGGGRPAGGAPRQIGVIDSAGRLSVSVESVPETDPLFDLPGAWNGMALELRDGTVEVLRGKGAGRWPTAEAVLADLLEISRGFGAELVHDHTGTLAPEVQHA